MRGTKKTAILKLRVEPEVKALAQLRAAEQGVTTSEYIRVLIQRDNGLIRETRGNEAMEPPMYEHSGQVPWNRSNDEYEREPIDWDRYGDPDEPMSHE
jgi:hypothetical protein